MDAVERVEASIADADKHDWRTATVRTTDLRTLLSLARSNGWQDISTAPKDGTRLILGWHPKDKYAGRVAVGEFGGMNWPSFYGLRATHYQPLPEPPLDRLRGSEG